MGILKTSPPKERLPGPFPEGRTCQSCGAELSRYNPHDSLCAPCGGWPRKQMVDTVDELHELMESAA